MRQIVLVIDNIHLNVEKPSAQSAANWKETSRVIDIVKDEIQYYKNLSFKIVNVDVDKYSRKDLEIVGIPSYPWLRIFEDGKILEDKKIETGLREKHWDEWSDKYGIKYTRAELDALDQSDELQAAEAARKKAEELLNEQKKAAEAAENARRAAETAKAAAEIAKREAEGLLSKNTNLLIIGAVVLAAFFFFKK